MNIQSSKLSFDLSQFPPLKSGQTHPQKSSEKALTKNTPNSVTTNNTQSHATTTNTVTTTHPMFDLKAMQEEIKCNLNADFSKLMNTEFSTFQNEMRESIAKIDMKYDDLNHHMGLLTQQYQHHYDMLSDLQNRIPSLPQRGDGHR